MEIGIPSLNIFQIGLLIKVRFFVVDAILNLFILELFVYLIRLFECKSNERVSAVIVSQVYEFCYEEDHVKNRPRKLRELYRMYSFWPT